MTPKQKVLKRWPDAGAFKVENKLWEIFKFRGATLYVVIGTGPTPRAAWADAERRMK